jgi:hypothetical protein
MVQPITTTMMSMKMQEAALKSFGEHGHAHARRAQVLNLIRRTHAKL